MRKLVLLMHSSLDGFVAGIKGEINWINADEELFDSVGILTEAADTAIYGRRTFEMMEAYWPTAADKPNATRHDIEHSRWVSKALKVVLSKTITHSEWNNTIFVSDRIEEEILKLKRMTGKNILIIGSPSVVQIFMQFNLIDEYYIYLNPIILDKGISLFSDVGKRVDLNLLDVIDFKSGVVGLHYENKIY